MDYIIETINHGKTPIERLEGIKAAIEERWPNIDDDTRKFDKNQAKSGFLGLFGKLKTTPKDRKDARKAEEKMRKDIKKDIEYND